MINRRHGGRGGAGEQQPLLAAHGTDGGSSSGGGVASAAGGGGLLGAAGSYGSYGSGEPQPKTLSDDPPDLSTFNQSSSYYHLPGSRRRSSWVLLVRCICGEYSNRCIARCLEVELTDVCMDARTHTGEAACADHRHSAGDAAPSHQSYVCCCVLGHVYSCFPPVYRPDLPFNMYTTSRHLPARDARPPLRSHRPPQRVDAWQHRHNLCLNAATHRVS